MRRRGSFDPSDYAFDWHVQKAGEILRDSEKPLPVSELARLIGRATSLQGDALRAAFQIEGHEDKQRGWELLAEQALKVLRRSRVVEEQETGWVWAKEGSEPVVVSSQGRKIRILTAEDRAIEGKEADRSLRLAPNPFTQHHLWAHHPLIRETGNLPGRIFDASHADTQELRESLLAFGYIAQLPILVDENGVTLDGRTREQLCRELREEFPEREDLDPVPLRLHLGEGPEANVERLKIAIGANIGRRNLSADTKHEIARYLYDDKNWTYEQIAEAFDVSQATAHRMAARGRSQRQAQARPKRYVDSPEWQAVADPLIHDWIEHKLSGDDVVAELKARGSKGTGWGTINERKAQLEAELERSSSTSFNLKEPEGAPGIGTPETPETPVPEVSEEPSIIEQVRYLIAAMEERDYDIDLIERARTILAMLDGSIVSEP